jgi:hypothetical protein
MDWIFLLLGLILGLLFIFDPDGAWNYFVPAEYGMAKNSRWDFQMRIIGIVMVFGGVAGLINKMR